MDPAGLIAIVAVGGAFALLGGGAFAVGGTMAGLIVRARLRGQRLPGRKTRVLGSLPKAGPSTWVTLEEISYALERFQSAFTVRFGRKTPGGSPMSPVEVRRLVEQAIDRITFHFVPGDSFVVDGRKYRGLTQPTPFGVYVRVAAREGGGLGRTAFFHEILHVILLNLPPYYDADADHEGTRWQGWTAEVTALEADFNAEFAHPLDIDERLLPYANKCASCDDV
jgi:hypothetical protein